MAAAQHRQLPILAPEIVTPFRDAVRLIDDEGVDSDALAQSPQGAVEKLRQQQAFRGQIEQFIVAPQQRGGAPRHVDARKLELMNWRDIVVLQQTHLVLHQGNQR